jgi:superfamily II DNA or RNA helicase
MNLRPYQAEAIASAYAAWRSGTQSVLLVMATGLGKTITFANIARDAVSRGKRVLVVAHTQELVRQARGAIERVVGCDIGVEMADESSIENGFSVPPVVVGTVQTLSAKRGDGIRAHKFRPRDFGLVIFDEAHHSVADSWRKVADYFDRAGVKRLGVTATPDRTDRTALGALYQVCAYDYGIRDGVLDGWLCPVRQSVVYVESLDLSGIRTTAGDLNQVDLADVLEREEVLHGMVSATIQIAKGRKTLCFCATVETARHAAEILDRHEPGSAAMVSGATPPDQRREILDGFKAGRFRYLCNCAVLTEGFDDPGIEVISMMRPTKSRSLYTQIVGRGTRTLPGVIDGIETSHARRAAIAESKKSSMLVIDFCGNAGRHRLVHAGDVLGGDAPSEQRVQAIDRARKSLEDRAKRGGETEERDVLSIIDEEERSIIEARESKSRSLLRAKARYSEHSEDPFEFSGIVPPSGRSATVVKTPATTRQIELLRKWGCPRPETLSRSQAKRCIDAIASRPSAKQAAWLQRNGFDPSQYTRKTASQKISEIMGR